MHELSPKSDCSADPRVAFFDHHAATWDHQAGDPAQILCRLSTLCERLGLRSGLNLLEIGCGTGLITGWLAESVRPGRVVAVDFSSAMLAKAREKNVDAEFRQMDICADLPDAGAYDVVLCFQCFPHFRNHPAALRNIAHGLKLDGRLVVLHLQGSQKMNEFHRQTGGAVHTDMLPPAERWPYLLSMGGLQLAGMEDREDLFLLEARKAAQ